MKTLLLLPVLFLTSCAGMGGMAFGITGTTKGVKWAVSAKVPDAKEPKPVTP